MKTCKKCNKEKSLDEFQLHRGRWRAGTCRECHKRYMADWRATGGEERLVARRNHGRRHRASRGVTPRIKASVQDKLALSLYHGALSRARKFGLPIDIDKGWVKERLDRGLCEVTGLTFAFSRKSPFVPSLDQREPGKGYTKENTQVVIWVYNAAKQDWGHDVVLVLAKALNR